MDFVWISEQTSIISLFNIELIRFYNQNKRLLRGTNGICKYSSPRFVFNNIY
jgi:hypothetical protein